MSDHKDVWLGPAIVSNPGISGGAPCVAERRLKTSMLTGRFRAGDSVRALADDYEIDISVVEDAIRFELEMQWKPLF